ncbi:MAG: ATP-binding protein [Spirulina sp. DLM2.Bin59]|nr:MAG: ATP-binding protein [Spirulina sp. DLM2.Bin59]
MLPSIFDHCQPRPEIQAGELSSEIFAAKIRPVVEGNAPPVYQQPTAFFANTFPTDGIKTLIREVFGRLSGTDAGSPIIRLETSFGGGKTHDQIALWHICREGRKIPGLDRFVDLKLIPDYAVQVAAIDGRDLDPENGVYHRETGITTKTLWGEIAYQVGGIRGYELLKGSDDSGISPGTSVLEQLTNGKPTVIILDELARHLRATRAKVIGESTLAKQVVAFLFSLMDLAAAGNQLILVYSLASAADTFGEETLELNEAIRASARQERVLSPSTDVEIYNIVKQRLFEQVSADAAEKAGQAYIHCYRGSRVDLPDGCQDASYSQAIANSYPFHPELFKLLTQKIAAIPEFQRTRGALRLLALVIQHLWQSRHDDSTNTVPLIHSHHIPVGLHPTVTSDLTSRLQRPLMRLPIQADLYNPNGREAYAQVQDQQWSNAGKPPFSTWVARTIFLHSLTQGISSGIRRSELNLSLLTPGLDSGFIEKVLDDLVKVAWYLDLDPVTSIARFKEEPSINKIIAEEKEQVSTSEAKEYLRERRDSIFASKVFHLIAAPDSASDVNDVADNLALCILDFDEDTVTNSQDPPPPLVEQIFNNTGEAGKFRIFRNRLLFLLANKTEIKRAIDLAREYKAVENISKNPNRLDDISEAQKKQLNIKKGELELAVRVALTNAYRHLFYPTKDDVKAPRDLMHYTLPPQDASMIKGKKNQQDIILKALRDCQKIRPQAEDPKDTFAPAYILQKVWPAGLEHWTTKNLRDQFFKQPELNFLIDQEVQKLRDTIRQGLKQGYWDLAMGKQVYIQTPETPLPLPETIEFSDRMVLYRRGILKLPEPRVIELHGELMPSSDVCKPVVVRWRAKGALNVQLHANDQFLRGDFRPQDEYSGMISETTLFRVVADYGEGETATKETQVLIGKNPVVDPPNGGGKPPGLFEVKPKSWRSQGTLNRLFNELSDECEKFKVQGISELSITVAQIIDYRKMSTSLGLLAKFQPHIDQSVTIQTGEQFLRLEYQGDVRGFQNMSGPVNSFLNQSNIQGEVSLTLTFKFEPSIAPNSHELNSLLSNLQRNPVERLNLAVNFWYKDQD